jgi:hypothetical protein
LEAGYDLIKGTRYTGGGGSTDFTHIRRLGNRGLLAAFNLLYGMRFSDLCYGYMGFRAEALSRLALAADGFEIETEIIVKAVRSNLRIGEVPSFESPRLNGVSNLSPFRDGQRALRTLVKQRLTTLPATLPSVPAVTMTAPIVLDNTAAFTPPPFTPGGRKDILLPGQTSEPHVVVLDSITNSDSVVLATIESTESLSGVSESPTSPVRRARKKALPSRLTASSCPP